MQKLGKGESFGAAGFDKQGNIVWLTNRVITIDGVRYGFRRIGLELEDADQNCHESLWKNATAGAWITIQAAVRGTATTPGWDNKQVGELDGKSFRLSNLHEELGKTPRRALSNEEKLMALIKKTGMSRTQILDMMEKVEG